MPYKITKTGKTYTIKNAETGKVVGHSDTKAKAQASVNARNAGAHGWKGKKKG
jgi:hypothetical protein